MHKNQNRVSLRITVKYILLQLPGLISFGLILLLLRPWVGIPAYLGWGLLGLWVAKDIFLFPFIWRFYDPAQYPDRFRMAGRNGFTLTPLNPDGYVRVQGERWQACIAEGQAPLEPGRAICVEGAEGLKLTVRACAADSPKQPRHRNN